MDYSLFITSVSLAIIVFTGHLLALRIKEQPTYLPLMMFFVAMAVILAKPLVVKLAPEWNLFFLVCTLPAMLLLPPSFWCYVEGLTHTRKWHLTRSHVKHFVLPIIGLFIAISTLLLPKDIVTAVLTDGGETALKAANSGIRYFVYALLIFTFVLILTWVVQSGLYVYLVFRRLATYRLQLKQVFATTESKEFAWITWLLVAIGSTWLVLAAYLVFDNVFRSLAFSFEPFKVVLLGMIWSIAIWALRHKPGFEEIYGEDNVTEVFEVVEGKPQKYQKSALSHEQADNIAKQVELAMREQRAYLDSNISLQKLAKAVGTTPNYLSQTLNEQLSTSFFDYVNNYRIEAASKLLKTSNTSVLDIAMAVGFNSKSSFYTAFKKATNMTPSQYRKSGAI